MPLGGDEMVPSTFGEGRRGPLAEGTAAALGGTLLIKLSRSSCERPHIWYIFLLRHSGFWLLAVMRWFPAHGEWALRALAEGTVAAAEGTLIQLSKPLVFSHDASMRRRHQAAFLPSMGAPWSAQSSGRSDIYRGNPQGAQCVLQSHSLGCAGKGAEVGAEAALAWETKET